MSRIITKQLSHSPHLLLLSKPILLFLALFVIAGCDGCEETEEKGSGHSGEPPTNGMKNDLGQIDFPPGWSMADGGQIIVSDTGIIVDEESEPFVCHITSCQGKLLECGDCIDNDEDGKTDWHDPECLGPCDNTEGPTLAAGIGGDTGGHCRVDCYFDYGNGPGNDDCHWDHRCDPLAVAPDYPPEGESCPYDESRVSSRDCPDDQSDDCMSYCRPLTPNGCDCFGCCTLPGLEERGTDGGDGYVWIGAMDSQKNATCTFADVTNAILCPPCTPVLECWNDCGPCEVCVGRPIPPPECFENPNVILNDMGEPVDTGPPSDGGADGGTSIEDRQCSGGEQPCGLEGQDVCVSNHYCISGCCIRVET